MFEIYPHVIVIDANIPNKSPRPIGSAESGEEENCYLITPKKTIEAQGSSQYYPHTGTIPLSLQVRNNLHSINLFPSFYCSLQSPHVKLTCKKKVSAKGFQQK